MLILNAGLDAVSAQYDKGIYFFKPGESKDISGTHRPYEILKRWGKYGLVDITFDETASKKFASPEIYIHDRRINGAVQALRNLLDRSQKFQVYDDECGDKKTPERFMIKKDHDKVLGKIKELEIYIEELNKVSITDMKLQRAEALKKQAEALLAEATSLDNKGNDGKDFINTQNTIKKRTA